MGILNDKARQSVFAQQKQHTTYTAPDKSVSTLVGDNDVDAVEGFCDRYTWKCTDIMYNDNNM